MGWAEQNPLSPSCCLKSGRSLSEGRGSSFSLEELGQEHVTSSPLSLLFWETGIRTPTCQV